MIKDLEFKQYPKVCSQHNVSNETKKRRRTIEQGMYKRKMKAALFRISTFISWREEHIQDLIYLDTLHTTGPSGEFIVLTTKELSYIERAMLNYMNTVIGNSGIGEL